MIELTGKKIAVVDDTDSILMLFTALLEAHKGTAITFNSGRTFLQQVQEISPDLILLDIQMPDLDGYKVLAQLKNLPATASTPVVALTAHAMSGDKEHILEQGFSGYIAKPVDTRAFPNQIASFLAG